MSETTREEVYRLVYDREVNAKGTYRISGEVARAVVRDTPSKVRVDDISQGTVALTGVSNGPKATGYYRLEPDAAEELAEALNNAAQYAREQRT